MVKPPKTMQPEAVNLKKAGREKTQAFSEDSFHHYMARKIDLQRQQFGLQLPPPPPPPQPPPQHQDKEIDEEEVKDPEPTRNSTKLEVRFANNASHPSIPSKRRKRKNNFTVSKILKRLKKKHGRNHCPHKTNEGRPESCSTNGGKSLQLEEDISSQSTTDSKDLIGEPAFDSTEDTKPRARLETIMEEADEMHMEQSEGQLMGEAEKQQTKNSPAKRHRPDLFFLDIVVMVNGYTNPDDGTIQRLLHKHGGDLEKYETSRVTHIIAERLSTAKANMYKNQRYPRPVCKPSWITDSVQAGMLLPEREYLIDEVKDESTIGMKSVSSFFQTENCAVEGCSGSQAGSTKQETGNIPPPLSQESSDCADRKPAVGTRETADSATDGLAREEPAAEKPSQDGPCSGTPQKIHANEKSGALDNPSDPQKDRYINGRIRTVGTDPNFLESFFAASRLSFIGSYKQRTRQSPVKNSTRSKGERFVFHVDMDCFFASVVLRNFPQYRNHPVAISHHGESRLGKVSRRDIPKDSSSECATCNYVARKFGVKKGMYLGRARALCPDLVILQYDFEGYEEVSEAVSDILEKHAADYAGYVEHVSCDEAYVEFYIQPNDCKDANEVAAELAEVIRKEIYESTQCTASIGVGSNKLLAKLGTDHVKPDGSYVVKDFKYLLKSLKLQDLNGIGYRLRTKLEEEDLLTVEDVWDLGGRGESELCRILGPGLGKKVYGYCQGRDDRAVQPAERKTIGAECNYGVRFDGPYGVEHMVEGLCREVEKRMTAVGVRGSKITLKVKQRKPGAPPPPKFLGHGSCFNLSKSQDTKSCIVTRNWRSLQVVAMEIFVEISVPKDDIRGMGIVVSKLVTDGEASVPHIEKTVPDWFRAKNAQVESKKPAEKTRTGSLPSVATETSNHREIACYSKPNHASAADSSSETNDANSECIWDTSDIALPALSQIHMSQVEVLPSPIRRHIVSKMEKAHRDSPVQEIGDSEHQRESRYRQTDVKRMFRLAAVKSGEQELPAAPGASVSLTQFECLPLEMQLQVANDDQRNVGALSPEKKWQRISSAIVPRAKHPTEYCSKKYCLSTEGKRPSEKVPTGESWTRKATEVSLDLPRSDSREFFHNNVQPLSSFMDDNLAADEEARHFVVEFLSLCVAEHRLSDVTVLLRCIRNRKDMWGVDAFDPIFVAVDGEVQHVYGAGIDPDWI